MIGLVIILLLVLFLPFTVKKVENNLEVFLFIMGSLAALVSGIMDAGLIKKALTDPLSISAAVLIAGLIFKWFQNSFERSILFLTRIFSLQIFLGLTVIFLGLFSSMITAIIAAIVLVIIVNVLPLDRESEIRFTVLACFSIGLGAVLTPIGEPLSTITISKLNEDFFFLIKLIGFDVIPALLLFGLLTIVLIKPKKYRLGLESKQISESYRDILTRTFKIYLFVMGLTFLGQGFEPFIREYILGLRPVLLYWINMTSAILDNATLAAAEISPSMDDTTIRAILLGLLISGGMLVPGNIPNIISAGKLHITSKEWASFAVPIGLVTMVLYFFVLFVF
nr:DUF1646 domain-containing protein [Neobacillus sp. Marseille-Q6967]